MNSPASNNKPFGKPLKTLRSQCDYTIIEEDDKKIIDVVKSGYKIYGGGILPLIFKYAKNEVSMYGEDDGMKVKIRPDGMLLEENVGVNAIVSFKTTCANTTERFVRDAAKFKYELSEGDVSGGSLKDHRQGIYSHDHGDASNYHSVPDRGFLLGC